MGDGKERIKTGRAFCPFAKLTIDFSNGGKPAYECRCNSYCPEGFQGNTIYVRVLEWELRKHDCAFYVSDCSDYDESLKNCED